MTDTMKEPEDLNQLQHSFLVAAEKLFVARLLSLENGSPSFPADLEDVSLPSIDDEAKDLVECLTVHLEMGNLTPAMTKLLSGYLKKLSGPQRWALLGLKKSNRKKSKTGRINSATNCFVMAIADGKTETEALIDAYNGYFSADRGGTQADLTPYERDLKKPSNRHANYAAQRMATVVRRAIESQSLIAERPSGRPKTHI
jgi:hypothetical protein